MPITSEQQQTTQLELEIISSPRDLEIARKRATFQLLESDVERSRYIKNLRGYTSAEIKKITS